MLDKKHMRINCWFVMKIKVLVQDVKVPAQGFFAIKDTSEDYWTVNL